MGKGDAKDKAPSSNPLQGGPSMVPYPGHMAGYVQGQHVMHGQM